MPLTLITAPSVEPVTLAEAKLQCRVDADLTADDARIGVLISAVREQAEHEIGGALVTQTWERTLDAFPVSGGAIELGMPPVQSLVSVKYLDAAGTEQTLAPSAYTLDAVAAPGWVLPAAGTDWPAAGDYANAVRVRFVAGFGAASSVPAAVKAWMLLHIAEWYAQLEAGADKPRDLLPHVARLLDCARQWWGRV